MKKPSLNKGFLFPPKAVEHRSFTYNKKIGEKACDLLDFEFLTHFIIPWERSLILLPS